MLFLVPGILVVWLGLGGGWWAALGLFLVGLWCWRAVGGPVAVVGAAVVVVDARTRSGH